jgi:uncharacterized protein (TIGR00251 family)
VKLVEKDGAIRFEVHAKPRARKSRVLGAKGDTLEVSIAAPPADGEANAELLRVLADVLGVPRRQIRILRGHGATRKLVEVTGIQADRALSLLLPAP